MRITAGTAVVSALSAIDVRMTEATAAVRAREPDAVHQLRIGVRRLRSVLAAYRAVFEAGSADALRDEFREFGHALGEVRDLEVRAERGKEGLLAAAERDAIGATEVDLARARLVEPTRHAHERAYTYLLARIADERAAHRRTSLEAFLSDPPFDDTGHGAASDVLARLLRHESKRALKASLRADQEDLASLHAARKAGRRLRYAAEAVSSEPVLIFGEHVVDLAEAGEAIHDVLGDHRDESLFAGMSTRCAARPRRRLRTRRSTRRWGMPRARLRPIGWTCSMMRSRIWSRRGRPLDCGVEPRRVGERRQPPARVSGARVVGRRPDRGAGARPR